MKTWYGVPDTNIEVSEDGTEFRWTFDRDGAEFLATELHPDGTSREMYLALRFADEVHGPEGPMGPMGPPGETSVIISPAGGQK